MPDSLLPHNASSQERDIEAVTGPALAPAVPLREIWNPDVCPEDMLPWLAYAVSVDVWDPSGSVEIRRQVINTSFDVHRTKGTRKSVELALSALGFTVDLSEWFEYGGAPYTFRIDAYSEDVFVAGVQTETPIYERVSRLIETVKPARTHFDLRIGESFRDGVNVRTAARQVQVHHGHIDPSPRPHETAPRLALRLSVRTSRISQTHHDPQPRPTHAVVGLHMRMATQARTVSHQTHHIQRRPAG